MSALAPRPEAELQRRARAAGLQPHYVDANDQPRTSTPRALEAALEVLSAAEAAQDAEPVNVVVVRGGESAPLALRVDERTQAVWHRDEGGGLRQLDLSGLLRGTDGHLELDLARLGLDIGYHELTVEQGDSSAHHFVMVAPPRLPTRPSRAGLFQPLYGLRSDDDLGVGSYRLFGDLGRLAGSSGFDFIGTTPCYAAFLDQPFDPSPYAPVSRIAWNELFLDLPSIPDLAACPEAVALLASAQAQEELRALRAGSRVDYRAVARFQRRVLELLASAVRETNGRRRRALDAFLERNPDIVKYAAFRARNELDSAGGADNAAGYHAYVQFLCDEQLRTLSGAGDVGLYLDFPVGVHPDGFDVANWSSCFLTGASAGAPPDAFFRNGQDWAFAPLSTYGLRASRYEYLIKCYRSAFEFAKLLRIDHVMGMERMWLVPDGCSAADGVYLTYPDRELRAVLLIEAARADATVVGEDLGTVPRSTSRNLDADGFLHSAVYRFEAGPDRPLPSMRRDSMVSFGTHDLARFAAFVTGSDLDEEVIDDEAQALAQARGERERWIASLRDALGLAPEGDSAELYVELMRRLGAGQPAALLVDLGDCLGDSIRENLPGTNDATRNWTHRCDPTVVAMTGDTTLLARLRSVAEAATTGARS